MKAAYLTGHGGLEVLAYGDLPVPEPGPGEARVAVRAVALNHLDVFVRQGWKGLNLALPPRGGLGRRRGGGRGGPRGRGPRAVGDAVVLAAGWSCGRCRACLAGNEHLCRQYHLFGEHRGGAGAGRFVAPARNLLSKPDGLSFVDAAAVGVAYLTAWHMLVTRAQVRLGRDGAGPRGLGGGERRRDPDRPAPGGAGHRHHQQPSRRPPGPRSSAPTR